MENANGVDWQEEVYQKIKYMKEMYLSNLKDLYENIAHQVFWFTTLQHDSLHHRLQNENIEKLKMFKVTLEHIMLFLQLRKQDIELNHKGKLVSVEKNISFFLRSSSTQSGTNPVQANLESLQQNSNALPHLLPIQPMQQRLSNQQLTPLCNRLLIQQQLLRSQQSMEYQQAMNALQQLMQWNNLTHLQHNSLSGVSTNSNTQQYMINSVQHGFNLDLGLSNSWNSLQQVSTGFLQQNPVNNLQHGNISSFSTQSGTNPIQANISSLQQNSTNVAEPAIKTTVPQSADAATTFSKTKVNATAASNATVDHTIANPPDVTASTVFHAASATTIS
ncbi:hypothetical protein R3W88_010967 [Solanum pinnatisectum]|uniref:Uncharacterized protein n=1 Tax=Solanum pinnatisectum TaxID=50273 RepID=A0AAV9L5I1_9SOLN|nr:hypothetical protein R3W88_010967 [Solanum pinnatisectum]